jgi:hypothetical protein
MSLLWTPTADAGELRLDPSFGIKGTAVAPLPGHPLEAGIYDVARDTSGRLIAAGEIVPRSEGALPAVGMVATAFQSNGTLDGSFGEAGFVAGFASGATGIAIQPDDKIVVVGYLNGGYSADINHKYSAAIARFNPDGSFDRSFQGGTSSI